MNYDYKIVNVDPTGAFVKRVALYLAILSSTVALALVILFILFERYLMLILPGAMILFSAVVWFLIGRSPSVFSYAFSSESLVVEANGTTIFKIGIRELKGAKTAVKSDFSDKTIKRFAFSNSQIVLKNRQEDTLISLQYRVAIHDEKRYLFAFDDYALSLIGGDEDGV